MINLIPKILANLFASFKSWGIDEHGKPRPMTFFLPSASLHSIAITAESTPPERPMTTPLHPEFLTYVLIKSLITIDTSFRNNLLII